MKATPNLILIITLLIVSCSNQQKSDQQSRKRFGGTLHVPLLSSAENLDPQTLMFKSDWQVCSLIYEGLVGYKDQSSRLIPMLAESWQVSDQGQRYIFKIRRGVYFHDDPCFEN